MPPLAVCVYTRRGRPCRWTRPSSESHVLALYKPDVSKISAQSAATAKSANSCRKYKEMLTPNYLTPRASSRAQRVSSLPVSALMAPPLPRLAEAERLVRRVDAVRQLRVKVLPRILEGELVGAAAGAVADGRRCAGRGRPSLAVFMYFGARQSRVLRNRLNAAN